MLDGFKIGDSVKIGINLNGRTWTSPQGEEKCFNTITGWKIEKEDSNNSAPAPQVVDMNAGSDDDLPF